MGNCVSIIKRKKEPSKAITLAIIGLDDAGKTTLCSVLSGEQPDPDIAPTVGFRNVKFSQSNFDVTVFDVGGGKNIRPIWKTYFGEIFGTIYVIDSSSRSRLSEARDVFRETLEHPQVSGKPVLVLANKVDKEDHMKEVDIFNGLDLEDTVNTNNCPSKLVMVSALSGTGNKMDKEIQQGLNWLFDKIRGSLSTLEPRVAEDMKAAKETRDLEREQRKARVKKQREEREKAEDLERTRLGLSKKEASDDEDIVDGDPFKALDMGKLTLKEQQMKEEKRKKQERMRELGYGDNVRGSKDDSYADRKFDLRDDPTLRLDDVDTRHSGMGLFGRSRGAALPPLEPLSSQYEESGLGTAEKKKQRKKKKLTEYHLDSHKDSDIGHRSANDTMGRLGLDLHDPGSWRRDADVHDLTPRVAKPKKIRMVKAGRIDEEEEERNELYRNNRHGLNHYNDLDDFGSSHGQKKRDDLYLSGRTGKQVSSMNGYDRFPHDRNREDSMYRESLKKISPPNLGRFEDEDKDVDEGIERDDSDNSDGAVDKYRVAHKGRNANSRKQRESYSDYRKDGGRRQLSDEEIDDYSSSSALKDTLRFPRSPTEDEPVPDFRKEIDKLRQRQSKEYSGNRNNGYSGVENGGYHNTYHRKDHSDEDREDDYSRVRNNRYGNLRSPTSDEDTEEHSKISDRSDHRRKKKRNLLRSNKLAPSDDDEINSPTRDRFGSPRMVQEHNSRNTSDMDTPTKDRNSRSTQLHRNVSRDSDFGMKWGLAEDLPTIDNSSTVRRIPNFDDSDGDIVY